MTVFAGLWDVLARIAPEATAVVIVRTVLKLITHAIDDKDRWHRLMFLMVPLLAMLVALVAVVCWWLLADGGVQVLLHHLGQPRT